MNPSPFQFALQAGAIDASALRNRIDNLDAGGFVFFEGRVRNHHQGRSVIRLRYEAYEKLATSEGQALVEEIARRLGLLNAVAVHRIGDLRPGDIAVWVGCAAAHRDAAFQGCRALIDSIKERVPIWKDETYADGTRLWVGSETIPRPGLPEGPA
jgi:molybdopterin synthase catalytic subunit